MPAQTALVALLLGAAVTVETSMVSMMKHGQLTFCAKQPCFSPNVCLPFLGVNTCVRTNTPKCAGMKCPPKHECVLLQDVCDSLPCHPKAYCVRSNPCGICQSPDQFCELIPKPVCRHTVEPTCMNMKCGYGEICLKEPLECNFPPCRVKLHCVPAWPWRFAQDGVRGARDGEAGGAGSAGGAGDAGDAGGAGGSGGSGGTFGSGGSYAGGSFGSHVPFAHNGVFGTARSVTGGAVEGNADGSSDKSGLEKKEQSAENDSGDESDSDDDDEEEQAL